MDEIVRAKGEGTIYFDPQRAKYVVKIPIGRTADGKTRFRKGQASTRREANALRLALIENRDKPTENIKIGVNFKTFVEQHFASQAGLQLRQSTIGNYSYILRNWAYPTFGDRPLATITSAEISEFLSRLSVSNSAHFVNHCRATLSHVFEAALAHHLITDNPVRRTRKVKNTSANQTFHRRHWSLQECRIALEASLGTSHALFVHLAIYTGLRHGELMALRWQDLDFENRTITVNRTLVELRQRLDKESPRVTFNEPKTSKSRRTLQIPETVIPIAVEHFEQQATQRGNLGPLWHDLDLIFPTRNGRPNPTSSHSRAFKKFLSEAGLREIRVHDIRHSFATNALELGVDLPSISRALGHSSLHMTMDTYARGAVGIQDRATEGLAKSLNDDVGISGN